MATGGSSSRKLDDTLVAVGFASAIAGGLILAGTFVATVPDTLLATGGLLFVLGLVVAFVVGYRDSRREGGSFFGAIGRGVRTLWRWVWAFMP